MSASDQLLGTKLGDYVIQRVLGQGGMARVYLGYDEQLDRYAAVKVTSPNLIASEEDEEYRDRFVREARSIARLAHPGIVSIYQFGQHKDSEEDQPLYYMAMSFVEGKDLRQILKDYNRAKQYMPYDEVLSAFKDIAAALDYAHRQGVIHRDVKPSNIMITTEGNAVLTDFGLALNAQEGTIGNTFGSVHYIAPEQAVSSAQASAQSDLYSLGVVLFEMLTGRVPFEDVSAMSVALKHISDPPPLPSKLNPRITPEVEDVIIKALDKDAKKRYESGREFVTALEGAFRSLPPEAGAFPSLADTNAMPFDIPTDRVDVDPEQISDDARNVMGLADQARETQNTEPLAQDIATATEWGAVGDDVADAPTTINNTDDFQTSDAPITPLPSQTPQSTMTTRDMQKVVIESPLDQSPQAIPDHEAVPPQTGRQRSSAVMIVLLMVVLVVGGAAVAFISGVEQPSEDDASVAGLQVGTNTPTDGALMTRTEDANSTASVVVSVAQAEIEDVELTETLMAGSATMALMPTLTNTPNFTATPMPTDTPTETLTATPTPSTTPSPTVTEETPKPTETPAITITPMLNAETTEDPQVLLYYDGRTLVLYNRSPGEFIDISELAFISERSDRPPIVFRADEWDTVRINSLRAGDCLQVYTISYNRLPDSDTPAQVCNSVQRFRSTVDEFWVSSSPDVMFEVRSGDDNTLLATCPTLLRNALEERRCVVELRQTEAEAQPTESASAATPRR